VLLLPEGWGLDESVTNQGLGSNSKFALKKLAEHISVGMEGTQESSSISTSKKTECSTFKERQTRKSRFFWDRNKLRHKKSRFGSPDQCIRPIVNTRRDGGYKKNLGVGEGKKRTKGGKKAKNVSDNF